MALIELMKSMTPEEWEAYASNCGSSAAHLKNVAYGKPVALGFADVLVAQSQGRLTLDGVPLSDQARQQRTLREVPHTEAA
jgi:hypothetical protein